MKIENTSLIQSMLTETNQNKKPTTDFNAQLLKEQSIESSPQPQLTQIPSMPNILPSNNVISNESASYLSIEEIQFFDKLF